MKAEEKTRKTVMGRTLDTNDLVHRRTGALIHPLFLYFDRWEGSSTGEFAIDFLGTKVNPKYQANLKPSPRRDKLRPEYLFADNEQYFEWLALLDSVIQANDKYTMIELGSARGTWLVRAAAAIAQVSAIPLEFVAVEGSEVRWEWMRQNFRDNGLDPEAHKLIHALVGTSDGSAYFLEADDPADAGYGDRVIGTEDDFERVRREYGVEEDHIEIGRKARTRHEDKSCVRLPCVSLPTLLEPLTQVDLIHMDVQGLEFDILQSSIDEISRKVKVICIGTHSVEVENHLRDLLKSHDWLPRYDFARLSRWATEWGALDFRDGCQVWINNKLIS